MSGSLDMSLDDLIKSSKKRGREEGKGSGSQRRSSKRAANRPTPYSAPKSVPKSSESRAYQNEGAAPSSRPLISAIETGTKLYVSNLDFGVTIDDIKELFSEVGDLKRSTIHYDKSGRSKGTAEVVFARKDDALAAIKRYNNVQLDGKPIKIEVIGASLSVPAANSQSMNGMPENMPRASGRGHGRRRRRGRGHQRKRSEAKNAQDLDADLENYHAQAMQAE